MQLEHLIVEHIWGQLTWLQIKLGFRLILEMYDMLLSWMLELTRDWPANMFFRV
jgi:hypothetical protein